MAVSGGEPDSQGQERSDSQAGVSLTQNPARAGAKRRQALRDRERRLLEQERRLLEQEVVAASCMFHWISAPLL